MKQVTLLGVGQIGASIGLGLKVEHGKKYRVVGYDPDQDVHQRAEKIGAVDSAIWNLDTAVRDADVVIISLPVNRAYEIMENIAPYLRDDVTVTDTCSTKRSILHWAADILPSHASFVGGHPLVKADATGRDEPSPYLFTQAPYAIIPHPRSRQSAIRDVQEICNDLGARPLFMDPDEHDSFSAAVAGVPAFVAAAALNAAADSPSWHEISKFVGKDFVSMSQPMANDPAWINGMASTNRDMLIYWIDQINLKLSNIKRMLESEEDVGDPEGELADILVNAWENRLRLDLGIQPAPPTSMQSPERMPSSGEATASMLMGGFIMKAFRGNKDKDDPTKYDRRKL